MDNLKILNKSACGIFRTLGMYDIGIPLLTFSYKCGNGSLRQCEQQLFKFQRICEGFLLCSCHHELAYAWGAIKIKQPPNSKKQTSPVLSRSILSHRSGKGCVLRQSKITEQRRTCHSTFRAYTFQTTSNCRHISSCFLLCQNTYVCGIVRQLEKESRMAVVKRPGREKPAKIE